ncbi:MAG TPA: hypothetical protein VNT42_13460 [Sphingomonas sp.]|nr:hypothetical protein [Sphingomonas sp.]
MIAAQILGAMTCVAAISAAPPPRGTMMLVPFGRTARNQMAALAIMNGAHLVQRGPAGSLIVIGERGRLLGPLSSHHILVLASNMPGCGRGPV